MSDDTPTQRLPQSGGDGELVEERKKSRALLFTLIGVGAALLVAIIVLLVILFGGGAGGGATPSPTASESASPTPSDSPTASDSPTPTPTPTPTPVPTVTVTAAPQDPPDDGNVHITSYSISPTTCTKFQQVVVHIKWKSENGQIAYFGVNTSNAQTSGMGWGLPPTGNSDNDFPDGYRPYEITCPDGQTSYTITVVGNGSSQSRTVTVKGQ